MKNNYSVVIGNDGTGEVEVTDTFINKLIAAGYNANELQNPQALINIICNFALSAANKINE